MVGQGRKALLFASTAVFALLLVFELTFAAATCRVCHTGRARRWHQRTNECAALMARPAGRSWRWWLLAPMWAVVGWLGVVRASNLLEPGRKRWKVDALVAGVMVIVRVCFRASLSMARRICTASSSTRPQRASPALNSCLR